MHSLHNLDGSNSETSFWYEPSFVEAKHGTTLDQNRWKNINFIREAIVRRLHSHPRRGDIQRTLIHYVHATDAVDFEAAFLRLWMVLERLTYTRQARYDDMIRRVVALFEDRVFDKQVLEHLRRRRNAIVHAGEPTAEMEALIWQLLWYVHHLLAFHIGYARRFVTKDEVAAFLDLPRDKNRLRDNARLIRMVLKDMGQPTKK